MRFIHPVITVVNSVWSAERAIRELAKKVEELQDLLNTEVGVSAAWSPGSVGAGVTVTKDVTLDEAKLGTPVLVAYDKSLLGIGMTLGWDIPTDGTVRVFLKNTTVAPVAVPAGNLRVQLLRPAL